jgi:hypothetical protein
MARGTQGRGRGRPPLHRYVRGRQAANIQASLPMPSESIIPSGSVAIDVPALKYTHKLTPSELQFLQNRQQAMIGVPRPPFHPSTSQEREKPLFLDSNNHLPPAWTLLSKVATLDLPHWFDEQVWGL